MAGVEEAQFTVRQTFAKTLGVAGRDGRVRASGNDLLDDDIGSRRPAGGRNKAHFHLYGNPQAQVFAERD